MLQCRTSWNWPRDPKVMTLVFNFGVGERLESARCLIHCCSVLYGVSKKPLYSECTIVMVQHSCCNTEICGHLRVTFGAGENGHVTEISEFWIYKPLLKSSNVSLSKDNSPRCNYAIFATLPHVCFICSGFAIFVENCSSFQLHLLLRGEWTLNYLACGTNTLPKSLHGRMMGKCACRNKIHSPFSKCIIQ